MGYYRSYASAPVSYFNLNPNLLNKIEQQAEKTRRWNQTRSALAANNADAIHQALQRQAAKDSEIRAQNRSLQKHFKEQWVKADLANVKTEFENKAKIAEAKAKELAAWKDFIPTAAQGLHELRKGWEEGQVKIAKGIHQRTGITDIKAYKQNVVIGENLEEFEKSENTFNRKLIDKHGGNVKKAREEAQVISRLSKYGQRYLKEFADLSWAQGFTSEANYGKGTYSVLLNNEKVDVTLPQVLAGMKDDPVLWKGALDTIIQTNRTTFSERIGNNNSNNDQLYSLLDTRESKLRKAYANADDKATRNHQLNIKEAKFNNALSPGQETGLVGARVGKYISVEAGKGEEYLAAANAEVTSMFIEGINLGKIEYAKGAESLLDTYIDVTNPDGTKTRKKWGEHHPGKAGEIQETLTKFYKESNEQTSAARKFAVETDQQQADALDPQLKDADRNRVLELYQLAVKNKQGPKVITKLSNRLTQFQTLDKENAKDIERRMIAGDYYSEKTIRNQGFDDPTVTRLLGVKDKYDVSALKPEFKKLVKKASVAAVDSAVKINALDDRALPDPTQFWAHNEAFEDMQLIYRNLRSQTDANGNPLHSEKDAATEASEIITKNIREGKNDEKSKWYIKTLRDGVAVSGYFPNLDSGIDPDISELPLQVARKKLKDNSTAWQTEQILPNNTLKTYARTGQQTSLINDVRKRINIDGKMVDEKVFMDAQLATYNAKNENKLELTSTAEETQSRRIKYQHQNRKPIVLQNYDDNHRVVNEQASLYQNILNPNWLAFDRLNDDTKLILYPQGQPTQVTA